MSGERTLIERLHDYDAQGDDNKARDLCLEAARFISEAVIAREKADERLVHALNSVTLTADALSEALRLLDLARLALRKIGEFDKYEPAGPAAAAARSTLSVLEAK